VIDDKIYVGYRDCKQISIIDSKTDQEIDQIALTLPNTNMLVGFVAVGDKLVLLGEEDKHEYDVARRMAQPTADYHIEKGKFGLQDRKIWQKDLLVIDTKSAQLISATEISIDTD
jgi:hypothetical protein